MTMQIHYKSFHPAEQKIWFANMAMRGGKTNTNGQCQPHSSCVFNPSGEKLSSLSQGYNLGGKSTFDRQFECIELISFLYRVSHRVGDPGFHLCKL